MEEAEKRIQKLHNKIAELRAENAALQRSIDEPKNTKPLSSKLRQEEMRYISLVNSAKEAIVGSDTSGRITSWNNGARTIFGYEADEIIGKPLTRLMPTQYRHAHKEGMKRYIDTRKTRVMGRVVELQGLRKNGEIFPVELSISTWESDNEIFFSAIIREITKRKNTEEQLLLFKKISLQVNNALSKGDAVYELLQTLCEYADWDYAEYWERNPAHSNISLYPVHYARLKKYERLADQSAHFSFNRGVGIPGLVWESGKGMMIHSLMDNSGSYIRPELILRYGLRSAMGFPVMVQDEVLGVIIIYSKKQKKENTGEESLADIFSALALQLGTWIESKENEDALANSEARFKGIFNQIFQFVGLLSPSGRILEANEATLKYSGSSISEIRNKKFWKLDWWKQSPGLNKQIKKNIEAARRGEAVRYDLKLISKSGRTIHIDFSLRPVTNDESEVIFLIPEGRNITAIKEAEEALKNSKKELEDEIQKMQTLINSTDDIIGAMDLNFNYLAINEADQAALKRLYGIEINQGDNLREKLRNVNLDQRDKIIEIWGRGLKGEAFEIIDVFGAKEREQHYYQLKYRPLYDSEGNLIGTSMIGRDVTRERKATEKLMESEQKLKSIIENDPNGVVITNKNGIIQIVNAVAITYFKIPRPKLLHAKMRYIRFNGYDNINVLIDTLLDPGQPNLIQAEATAITPDQEFPVEVSVSTIPAEGEPLILFVMRDVTEKKLARELLENSEKKFRTLVENLPDLIAVFDKDLRYTYVSNRSVALRNRSLDHMLGKNFEEMNVDKVEREDYEARLREVLRSGNQRRMVDELQIDNKSVYLDTLLVPIKNSVSGTAESVLAISRDITTLKQYEQQLENAHDQLEKKVRERTAALERSNRELEQFAYSASHDMQEPLRKIMAFSELVMKNEEENLSKRGRAHLNKMNESVMRMYQLIEDLLTFSRVMQIKPQFEEINLAELMTEVLTDLEYQIVENGTKVKWDKKLPRIQGEKTQIKQLLQNLLSNAIKYSRSSNPPIIEIKCHENEKYHSIVVKDNGIGFDEQYKERIFKPFQRLHGKKEFPGTGVGLAIVQKIVDIHEGTVTVTSAVGRGSTFTVHLPVN